MALRYAPTAIVAPAPSIPSMADIQRLPLAVHGSYEMTDDEVQWLRSRIYSLNKSHVKGWRWRTSRLPAGKRNRFNLIVWRVK